MKKQLHVFIVLLMISTFWVSAQIAPDVNNILHVNKSVSGGDGSGNSWANAVPELADVLVYAKQQNNYTSGNPLKIFVAKGTYNPKYSPADGANFGTDQGRNNSFLMVNNIQLYGGFDPANGITTLANNRILPQSGGSGTILSGERGIANDISDNSYYVFVSSGAVGVASLDGFTLTEGNSNVSSAVTINGNAVYSIAGGGLLNFSSSPKLVNVSISGNNATYGGGLYNFSSTSTLTNVIVSNNTATYGGAMANFSSSPKMVNVIVSGNSATSHSGGIYNSASSPTLTNVTLSGNTSTNVNGMYNDSNSSPVIKNSIIWGVIQNATGSSYTANHCLIQGNSNTNNNNIDATGITTSNIFTDATNGDYTLLNTSPVINLGDNSAYTTAGGNLGSDKDLAGKPRLFGTTIDIGSYESQALQFSPDANNILYVNKSVSGGNGKGGSWTNAISELADALKYAKQRNSYTNGNPLKIFVAKGTYKPLYSAQDGNFGNADGRNNTFLMVSNVQLHGGFAGTETTLADRDLSLTTNKTILSGDIDNNDVLISPVPISGNPYTYNSIANNAYHVVVSAGDVETAIIDGFTITGANANFPNGTTINTKTVVQVYGGGITTISSSPTMSNLTVSGNAANEIGGGMYNHSSSPAITNVIIANNTVQGNGGGMYNRASSAPTLTNVTITGNKANYGGDGNELSNDASSPNINNSIIFGKTTFNNSIGIYNINGSTPIYKYSLIQSNDTSNGNIDGTFIRYTDIFTDSDNGDYSLNFYSPAINSGDNTAYTTAGGDLQNDVDLGGQTRVYNGLPANDKIDLGAFEYQGEPVSPNANNILFVNKSVVGGDKTGNSWANAIIELGDALKYAKKRNVYTNSNPLKIFVAKGTYKPMYSARNDETFFTDQGRSNTFFMVKNVQLFGGFAGTESALADRDLSIIANKTTLSGDLGTENDKNDNSYHVIISVGDVDATIIDGFTITGGYANGPNYFPISSTISIRGVLGGGIHNYSSSPTLTNLIITGNETSSSGGASGGGIYNDSSSPVLNNVIISDNKSYDGAGMGNFSYSSPILTNVHIFGNVSSGGGGGMYNHSSSSPVLTNVIISDNTAYYGAGMFNYYSPPTLTNVTISSNNAISYGGAMTNNNSSPIINNSILWGNTATNIDRSISNSGSSTPIISYSLVEDLDNTTSNGLDGTDINNAPMFTDAINGDYSLQVSSPVINLGSNSAYEAADNDTDNNNLQNDVDLAGNPRLFGNIIDMGAYESQVAPITPDGNNILYVNKNVSGGEGSGDSWANALPQLADALVWAKQNEEISWATTPLQIFVAKGTYKPLYSPEDGNFGNDEVRDNTFLLVNNVQVYGGFAGTENTLAERNLTLTANKTTLSGDFDDDDVVTGAGSTLSITNNTENAYHVVISAGDVGTARLDGFTISGGKANGTSTLTINNYDFYKNIGSGIFNHNTSPLLTNLVISENTANGGAGIYNVSSNPLVTKVSISRNMANFGGGMYNDTANPVLTNVTFSGNDAKDGAIPELQCAEYNTVDDCIAAGSGCAWWGVCIDSGESVGFGGGVYNKNSSPILTNVTFSGNQADSDGGGMYNMNNSSPELYNSLVTGNSANISSPGIYNENSTPVIRYSLIQDLTDTTNGNIDATGITDIDLFTDPANGDYSLLATSPVINIGDNTAYTNAGGDLQNDVDLAGNSRVYDGSPNPDMIDMGAYEFQGEPVLPTDFFITTWQTTTASESITIPTFSGETYNYTVDWGDGNSNTGLTGDATHTYAAAGTYTVKINGTFPRIYFNNTEGKDKIVSIEQWGTNVWSSMNSAFLGCENLVGNATDAPDLSGVTDMSSMFQGASVFNEDISNWNVDNVTNMNRMFASASAFNQDLAAWNMDNVNDMAFMFAFASFDQNISNWNVENVTNMSYMFAYASAFNKNIGNWNVGSVTDMSRMFQGTSEFNQDIGNWNVSSVTDMQGMFGYASAFNQNIGSWNVGNVTNMSSMFEDVTLSTANYDALLNGWNTLTLQNGVSFSGGNSTYCAGESARNNMMSVFGWTITDGGATIGCSTDYVWEDNSWTPMDPQGNATPTDNIWVMNGSTSFIQALEVNDISIISGATLNVEDVLTINGDITNNGDLVFKSTATKNGELAAVPASSSITGEITVERYMSDNRAYRFMSSPVTTTSSIHTNWQEGATSATDNPDQSYGTHITGSESGANGFDATLTGNPSLYTLDVDIQQFQLVDNTNVNTISAGNGYLMFVRGDRSIDLGSNDSHSATTLRTTGIMHAGTFTDNTNVSDLEGEFNLIANPYQSAVNLNSVIADSQNLNSNFAYVYDPSLGDNGGYVTVTLSDGNNTSGSMANEFLQPGQAVQVATASDGATSITFNETAKTPGNYTLTSRNASLATENPQIIGQLFTAENYASEGSVHDSFGIYFSEDFSNALTNEDAVKPFNFTENLGIVNGEDILSIERRALPIEDEEIHLFSNNYNHSDYVLKLNIEQMENVSVFLKDNYTQEEIQLEDGINVYTFTVNQDLETSLASDRFYFYFGEESLSAENTITNYGIELYPNPTESGSTFYITTGQFEGNHAKVSITDVLGKTLYQTEQEFSNGKVSIQPEATLSSGVYFVQVAQNGKKVVMRLIVK